MAYFSGLSAALCTKLDGNKNLVEQTGAVRNGRTTFRSSLLVTVQRSKNHSGSIDC